MKSFRFGWLMVIAGIVPVASAQAEYPDKLLRWIVTMPAGGGNDAVVRPIAKRLSDVLGKQVIVDNRGGAGGMIGAALAAKSSPDGYTLVLLTLGHAIAVNLYKDNANIDLLRDFSPVTLLAANPSVLVVHPALPVKSVQQLLALCKARPGQLTYSSAGNGTPNHVAAELFSYMTGTKMTHLPYKGGGSSMIGLIGGEASLSFASMPSSIAHIRSSRLRAIAVTTAQRSPSMPGLPTISESGVPGFEAETWFGLSVPAGTPKEIVMRLNGEVHKALQIPEVMQQFDNAGLQVRTSTPEQYAAFTRSEVEKWGKVVKASGMRAE